MVIYGKVVDANVIRFKSWILDNLGKSLKGNRLRLGP